MPHTTSRSASSSVATQPALDSANRRIFTIQTFLSNGLSAYDMDTFVSAGTDPGFPYIQAVYPQLVRWGRYGIAFTNNNTGYGVQTLYIGGSTLVP